jgi:uncharacterized protein (TIGR01777 family)
VERAATTAAREVLHWNPATGALDGEALEALDAVVHLAGANVAGGRWTKARKQEIRDSRGPATQRLCETLAGLQRPPTLISASAIGFYGNRGDEELDESSAAGEGYLCEVAREWEAATKPLEDRGARVVHLRIGVVLGKDATGKPGGALARMRLPFLLGLGGRIGTGRQYMSWIALDDLTSLIAFALDCQELRGPVNATAPQPVTNAQFTKALGRVLRRPTMLPAPAAGLRLLLGEMADALLLSSQRVLPRRAVASGFEFAHGDLESALRAVMR